MQNNAVDTRLGRAKRLHRQRRPPHPATKPANRLRGGQLTYTDCRGCKTVRSHSHRRGLLKLPHLFATPAMCGGKTQSGICPLHILPTHLSPDRLFDCPKTRHRSVDEDEETICTTCNECEEVVQVSSPLSASSHSAF
ncbi:hypothetical protein TcWFU_005725 [Taenia crassiceps]|uniref:Uncharacterized protein n=1 Tax=Taenia crassiceps TaxID=6207 RepID=A0ABR4Q302_9CEST